MQLLSRLGRYRYWGEIWEADEYTVGKEFVCNTGDPSLIPGPGSFPGEGTGYPLQYSLASLVAQLAKNHL